MRVKGPEMDPSKRNEIVQMLRREDLTLIEIARAVNCQQLEVSQINKEKKIRIYDGRGSKWKKGRGFKSKPTEGSNSGKRQKDEQRKKAQN